MTRIQIPKVYDVYHTEGVELVSYVHSEDCDRSTFDGQPAASTWKPIVVERITENEGKKRLPVDFPRGNVGDLVLNRNAKDKIGAFLEQYGEFLPLICDDGEFWTLNVTCMIDALDEERCVLRRFKEDGTIMIIRKFAFHPEALIDAVIFRLPQYARGSIFVTTPFVELIQSSGLTGLKFKQIWAPN